jgi:hypothetical protein
MEASDLSKIAGGSASGKQTFEMDGTQVNEKYLYVLKYDLDASRTGNTDVNANTNR